MYLCHVIDHVGQQTICNHVQNKTVKFERISKHLYLLFFNIVWAVCPVSHLSLAASRFTGRCFPHGKWML